MKTTRLRANLAEMRPVNPSPMTGPVSIGPKLRATRLAQGLTIAQLAEATGLTKGFISRVERDGTSPSVATLLSLCQVLSLPVGSLFEPPEHEVVRLEDAPRINFGGSAVSEKLLTPRSEARVQIVRSILEPGASGGDDFYTINCEIEILHVLRGSVTVRFPHETVELVEGNTLALPGREPHSWRNDSGSEAELLWTFVPAAWSGSA